MKGILVEVLAMGGDESGMHHSKSVAKKEIREDLNRIANHLKLVPLLE